MAFDARSVRSFTAPGWIKLGSTAAAIFLVTLVYIIFQSTRPHTWIPFGVIAALVLLTAIDALTTRVALSDTKLIIRRNLRLSEYSRSSILRVSWEGGAPVSIEVAAVGWIRLPYVGHAQSLLHTLEAWITRDAVA